MEGFCGQMPRESQPVESPSCPPPQLPHSWALAHLTLGGVLHLDGHKGTLGCRIPTQGVAVLSLDPWSRGVQFHVQQRALLIQHRVIKEAAEQVIGEVLHVLHKVVQVLWEVLGRAEETQFGLERGTGTAVTVTSCSFLPTIPTLMSPPPSP